MFRSSYSVGASHLLPLENVPQVLEAQTLQELADVHIQNGNLKKIETEIYYKH